MSESCTHGARGDGASICVTILGIAKQKCEHLTALPMRGNTRVSASVSTSVWRRSVRTELTADRRAVVLVAGGPGMLWPLSCAALLWTETLRASASSTLEALVSDFSTRMPLHYASTLDRPRFEGR